MDKYRQLCRGRFRRREDIEIETVFAYVVVRHELVSPGTKLGHDLLDATGRELVCLEHVGPSHNGLRFAPAQGANRRRSERNPLIGENRRVRTGNAGNESACNLDLLAECGTQGKGGGNK